MQQTRNRWIATGVFLALAAVLIVLALKVVGGGGGEEGVPTLAMAERLFEEDAAGQTVVYIEVTDNRNNLTFAASTEDGETWTVEQAPADTDPALPADNSRLSGAVISLPNLSPIRTLTSIEALDPYGLDEPHFTVRYILSGGAEHTLYVGSINPNDTGFYVRVADVDAPVDTVYLIPKYTLDEVIGFANDPPVIVPTPTPEVIQS